MFSYNLLSLSSLFWVVLPNSSTNCIVCFNLRSSVTIVSTQAYHSSGCIVSFIAASVVEGWEERERVMHESIVIFLILLLIEIVLRKFSALSLWPLFCLLVFCLWRADLFLNIPYRYNSILKITLRNFWL